MAEVFNPNKPRDLALINVLAERFLVDACVIVAWLKTVDFKAVTEEIAGYTEVPYR